MATTQVDNNEVATLQFASVWDLSPWGSGGITGSLPPQGLWDLHVLSVEQKSCLVFSNKQKPTPQTTYDVTNSVWVRPPYSLDQNGHGLLFECIKPHTPLWVSTWGAPLVTRTDGPAFGDVPPNHGSENGILLPWGLEAATVIVAPTLTSYAGTVNGTLWGQSPTGIWSRIQNLTGSAFYTIPIANALLWRRLYVTLDAATAAGDFLVAVDPITLIGQDFTGYAGGGRIRDPYVKVRFGAVLVANDSLSMNVPPSGTFYQANAPGPRPGCGCAACQAGKACGCS